MLFEKLRELWAAIWELFCNIWDSFWGVFSYAANFRKQERLKRQADEHYIFREESKKRMSKWVLKERKSMEKLLKSNTIPKKLKQDMSVYHYISTVLLNKNPNWTPEEMIYNFYMYLHPSYMAYFSAWRDLKHVLRMDAQSFKNCKDGYLRKYANVMDTQSRASMVLDEKKKVALEIKKKQGDYQKYKRAITDKLDVEMLEIDKKVLEKQRMEAENALKRLDTTIKSSKTITDMSKKKGKG